MIRDYENPLVSLNVWPAIRGVAYLLGGFYGGPGEAHLMEAWTDEWNLALERPSPAEPQGERAGHGSIKAGWGGGAQGGHLYLAKQANWL